MYDYWYYDNQPDTLHEALLGNFEECECQSRQFKPTDCLDEDVAVFYENMGMTIY